MSGATFAHGVRAIDTMIDAHWHGGNAELVSKMGVKDAASAGFVHPAQYLFKGIQERIGDGDTADSLVALFDHHGIDKGLVSIDLHDAQPAIDCLEKYPDRFFAKVRVNPLDGIAALRKAEALVKKYPKHIRGIGVTPFACQKPPNDKSYFPVYTKAVDWGIPVTVNVGIPGPRVPGECQNPMYLDEVMYFFPDLVVVMAHGGEPWEALCAKLMLKWPNLYYMTSAFAPKRYPEAIIKFANSRGADKVMYAGYHPGLAFDRVQKEMADVPFKADVWPKFLRENAKKVFGV